MATDLDSAYTYAQTINYEVYLTAGDVTSGKFLGTASIDLPEVTYQTQDINGAGIGGTINYPSLWLTDSLAVTLHWRSVTAHMTTLARQRSLSLTMYSAVNTYKNSDGSLAPMSIAITVQGMPKKTGLGKLQPNELMDGETEIEVIQLKMTVNGAEKIYIDKVNYELRMDGQEDEFDTVKNILNGEYASTTSTTELGGE